jgi:hypothetical protein
MREENHLRKITGSSGAFCSHCCKPISQRAGTNGFATLPTGRFRTPGTTTFGSEEMEGSAVTAGSSVDGFVKVSTEGSGSEGGAHDSVCTRV